MTTQEIIHNLKCRLKEKSTWRGLSYVLTALGVITTPEQAEAIIALGLSISGAINILRKEK